ncbi:unnamed protein product [Adineta steineri]|uniref:Uncharacterized protein n=1 Tax=Adineta steineri TaxID=433720 RepID=A0A816EBC8_9BILA|nr:unnamed protein product [Adineta steineri]CAF1643854.1 unnamed protein product [Adineta steineri]
MTTPYIPVLPSEMIDRLSEELSGDDLFHFTLINYYYLGISNHHLIRLLSRQTNILLIKEINELIAMYKSPYMIFENYVGVQLSPYLLQSRSLSIDELALFKVLGKNCSQPQIVTNFAQFLRNFIDRYEYDFWTDAINWDLFVVAGGSVVLSMLAQAPQEKGSDVDLFFVKQNSQLFKEAVDQLETRLQNKYFVRRKTIWANRLIQFDLFRNCSIKDIINGKTFIPSVVIQLIRPTTTPTSISRIIHSFDLDICAAAFNSKEVIISFSCLQALNSGHTTCYDVPISASEFIRKAQRLVKYQQRGFNILCPKEFDINAYLDTAVEDCKELQSARIYRFRRHKFGDNCDSFFLQKKFCENYLN